MYLTIKQQLKHLSKDDYRVLRELCRTSKNLMNEAIYVNRQYFFREGKYLGYEKTYAILKASENYRILNSNMAQQSMKVVDGMFASFIALLRLVKKKQYDSRAVKIPQLSRLYTKLCFDGTNSLQLLRKIVSIHRKLYRLALNLPKDGYAPLIVQQFMINNQTFTLPYSRKYGTEHSKLTVKVPPILEGKKVKYIRIIPINNDRFFEIQYTYDAVEAQSELDKQKALAIDFGLNNLMTCATSEGDTFIIDGRRLKAINQWYNKVNAILAGIKDKQKYGKKPTFRQRQLARKRKLRVNDYISKACRKVINYCLVNGIGILVCGYNVTFQKDTHMGNVNNQNFVNIPYGEIRQKLAYLCELYGIEYHEQEESYTSKASFWDKDEMPIYNADNPQKYEFSGSRIHRGMYRTSTGFEFNADVNGALNILRKSNVVSLMGLYSRGGLATPLRIRMPVYAGGNLKSNFSRTPCL